MLLWEWTYKLRIYFPSLRSSGERVGMIPLNCAQVCEKTKEYDVMYEVSIMSALAFIRWEDVNKDICVEIVTSHPNNLSICIKGSCLFGNQHTTLLEKYPILFFWWISMKRACMRRP